MRLMPLKYTKKEILKWIDIVYNPSPGFIKDLSENWKEFGDLFIDRIARNLYEDIRRARMLITAPFTFNNDFSSLSAEEKMIWYDYASCIPEKLKALNLFIRKYSEFCGTCIITDEEIEELAAMDHSGIHSSEMADTQGKVEMSPYRLRKENVPFKKIPDARKWFFKELNYLIPPQLRKIGYEIIRPVEVLEIDLNMTRKLARAVHSRYLQNIRRSVNRIDDKTDFPDENNSIQNLIEFDDLPDDIKYSNIDNAYHIPAKLLSIGYKLRKVRKGYRSVALHLDDEEIETMAIVEHIRWSWDKRLNGWIYGNVKDNDNRIHPGLIPYDELPENEKEKDRELVRLIPALLKDINYEAYPVNPAIIKELSYAIKPQSSVHRLLNEIRELNDQIRILISGSPEINEKVKIINDKILESINDVSGSYSYARHIQETFLPDSIFVRECFPDSFVLYKPKDIVSGDFYFFGKHNDQIIFAAADCTGHGIPASLISTIGYGVLDQAVNELKITDPPNILHHLYSRIHRFMRRNEDNTGLSDDMDIVVCNYNTTSGSLVFSSVKNSLFQISGDELSEYRANNYIEECMKEGVCSFKSDSIRIRQNDTVYIFSDGYADQFGGKNHKKYQSGRFKTFLQNIQGYPMPEQGDRLYEEIERWREMNMEEQTDDILVIGIRF